MYVFTYTIYIVVLSHNQYTFNSCKEIIQRFNEVIGDTPIPQLLPPSTSNIKFVVSVGCQFITPSYLAIVFINSKQHKQSPYAL